MDGYLRFNWNRLGSFLFLLLLMDIVIEDLLLMEVESENALSRPALEDLSDNIVDDLISPR